MTTQRKTMEAIHLPPGFALVGPYSCKGTHPNGVEVVVHSNASRRYSYTLNIVPPGADYRKPTSFVQIRSRYEYCSVGHAARVGMRHAAKERTGGFTPRPTLRSWCAERWQKASPYTILAGALVLILGLVRTCCPVPEGRADTMATGTATVGRIAVDAKMLRDSSYVRNLTDAEIGSDERPLAVWYVGCLVATLGPFELRVYPDNRWLVADENRIIKSGEAPDQAGAKTLAAGTFADLIVWHEERDYRSLAGAGYEGAITWAQRADGQWGYYATVQSGFLQLFDRPVDSLAAGREQIELAVLKDQKRVCAFSRSYPDVDPRAAGRLSAGTGQRFVRVNEYGSAVGPTGGRVWQES